MSNAVLSKTKYGEIKPKSTSAWTTFYKQRSLYAMVLPGMLFFLLFRYLPLTGSIIAFQDYNLFKGIMNSDWVGFKWFEQFFTYPNMRRVFVNTLIISLYQLIFSFPAPILLALLLNEVRRARLKGTVQTIVYLPHFLSWTIVFGLTHMVLSLNSGLLNQLLQVLGFDAINFLMKAEAFRSIIILSGIWKEMGWIAIIFLAALVGISPTLYESAKIDGAGRWQQFVHITWQGIKPAIIIMLLLKLGVILDSGVDQIYVFLNPMTLSTGDVLDTYTYRTGVVEGHYSLTTAIGLFKSVIGFVLLALANRLSKAVAGEGLY